MIAAVGAGEGAAAGEIQQGSLQKVTDAKMSKSIMSMLSVLSVASQATAAIGEVMGIQSLASLLSYASATSALSSLETVALASMAAQQSAAETWYNSDQEINMKATSSRPTKREDVAGATPAPSMSIPPPPGTPYMILPADKRKNEVPAGVNEYNFRMCQYDFIRMNQTGKHLLVDQPQPQSK